MANMSETITHKAIKSTKWVFLSTIISKIWQPIITIILARLLMPKDFGLMALAGVVTSFMVMFQDMGLSSALIQRKDKIEEAANVVFWTNMGLGVIWYLLIFVFSPYISIFFNNEEVTSILRVMGLSFIISPLISVQLTLLSKELEFRRLFYFNLIPALVPGMISVTLAYSGYGVWALVYGSLISLMINVLIMWIYFPWKPRWSYNTSVSKELLGFGGFVSVEAILGWSITKIDNIFVGRFLEAGQLGIYNLGWNIGSWPAQNITAPLTKILYPMFSRLQFDLDAVKKNYLKILELISIITLPLGVLIAVTAHLFIPVLLGKKWIEVIPIIRIFSVIGILASIVWVTPQVYRAIDRPDIMPKFLTARSIVSIPAYYFAAQKGIIFLCVTHLLLVLIFVPINIYISMKVLKITVKEILSKFVAPVSCTLLMSITIVISLILIKKSPVMSDLLIILLIALFSMMIYLLLLYFRHRQTFFEIKKLVGHAIF